MVNHQEISQKASYVLCLVVIAFSIIVLRVFYLAGLKGEDYLEKALKPQRKTVVEIPPRGTIRDRFDLPLAVNRSQYNAAVSFDQIRKIPAITWEKGEGGKRKRVYKRRKYVERFSQMLGKALEMDPVKIEDLIYSQASLFPNTPFVLKEDIPERLYYSLRILEKDWVGLAMQRGTKRYYPQGKTGADIIGYIGAINRKQYLAIAQEIEELSLFLKKREEGFPAMLPKGFESSSAVENRLNQLKEKVYTVHTNVGKTGIERKFDEALRGVYGKCLIEISSKGNFIRNLPGMKKGKPGNRILLTLSSELQEYAEELLILNEKDRDLYFPVAGKGHDQISPPWMKGGAIVAMIPATGEIVAMASYPRFDPNDFILTDKNRKEKIERIRKDLESLRYIGGIWDGAFPMERERTATIETKKLSWDFYLDQILSRNCQVRKSLGKVSSLKEAISLQRSVKTVQALLGKESIRKTLESLYWDSAGEGNSFSLELSLEKSHLDPFLKPIESLRDQLLFLDLLRVVALEETFSEKALRESGTLSLAQYRALSQAYFCVKKEVKEQVEALYQKWIFPQWRTAHFKRFLKEKREEEKRRKTYSRPYTDYLEGCKEILFSHFWKESEWKFLEAFIYDKLACQSNLSPFLFHLVVNSQEVTGPLKEALFSLRQADLSLDLLATMQPFENLKKPLWGDDTSLRERTLQGLASAFYPRNGYGHAKSFAYSEATPIGSLFKVVTGYEALKQTERKFKQGSSLFNKLNPLEIIDEINPNVVTNTGVVLGRYLDGSLITRHHKGGRMPKSHASLGKIDFQTALERSSNIYFSLLASEIIAHPGDLLKTSAHLGFGKPTGVDLYGEVGGCLPNDLRYNRTGLYAFAIGQHSLSVTPLQSTVMLATIGNDGHVLKPQLLKKEVDEEKEIEKGPTVVRKVPMSPSVRGALIEGMKRVVSGENGPAQPYRIRTLYQYPQWMRHYKRLQGQFIGKTSTAEFIYRPFLDREGASLVCKDIWFGALSFQEGDDYQTALPELAVVVYLKFGDYGKEAAPLAALMIKKWREITQKYAQKSPCN